MELLQPVHKKESGQSLLEAVIASAMILIVVGGLVSVVIGALKNVQFAKNQSLATKYANEAMEKTRVLRDQSATWAVFTGSCNGFNPPPVPSAPFTRTVSCTQPGADTNTRQVTITVSWTDSSGTHQSRLSSNFTNQSLWK